MESDLIRISTQGGEKVRNEREEWALREAGRRVRLRFVEDRLPCAQAFEDDDQHILLVKEALLDGYRLGFDHAAGALKSEEGAPRSRSLEKTIIEWFIENPNLTFLEVCDNTHLGRRSSRGERRLFHNIPRAPKRPREGMYWGERLRQLAAERTNLDNGIPCNPWTAWQLAQDEKERTALRERLETWIAKLRRRAKILAGGAMLLQSGADFITKEPVPWHQEPAQTAIDEPWPDE